MAKAKSTATPVAAAAGAPVFPTAEAIHATTQAVLNAPPKGVNWEGFEAELTDAFSKTKEAEDSLRVLAGKMFTCGFRFAMLNDEKGAMNDKAPHYIELRKRLTTRLSKKEQGLLSMNRFEAATLDVVEKAIRTTSRKRLDKMMSDIRRHLKSVEEITTNKVVKTLEQKIYGILTDVREMIQKADPNKVKFDIMQALDDCDTLRNHFDI